MARPTAASEARVTPDAHDVGHETRSTFDRFAAVPIIVALMLLSAAVAVRQVDDGFTPRYTALDLRHPNDFLSDPSIVGPSRIGLLEWRGAEALVVRGVSVRRGDLLKAKVFAECGRGELVVRVGSGQPLRVPARAAWRQVELTLPNDGTEIRWEKATPQPCPVHFSRMTIAGFHGEATGVVEGHLIVGRGSPSAVRWDPRVTGAAGPLLAFGLVWAWELFAMRAPAPRRRRVALWAAGVPVLVLAAFEAYGTATGVWLVMPSRTPLVVLVAAAAVVVAAGAGSLCVSWLRCLHGSPVAPIRAAVRDLRAACTQAEDEAAADDGGTWRMPWRPLLVFTLGAVALLAVFALKVVQDFRGPILDGGDTAQWIHQAHYFARNFSLRPWPWLELDNDQLFFPYGGCNVFQPWVFEMDLWTAVHNIVFGLGPWLQTYFLFSVLATALGAFVLLAREHTRGRAALLAGALAFANYYAVAKFPVHASIACVHWTVLGIVLDAIIVRRHCAKRPWSARLMLARALLLFLALGLELGYVAGIALTSFAVSVGFIAIRSVVIDRAKAAALRARASAVVEELRTNFRAHRIQAVALALASALAGALYGSLALEVWRASSRFDFRGMPMGSWWANPARMIIPVLPFFNPVRNEGLFRDSHEALFAASPGAFFVLAAALGILVAGRRRLSTVPSLLVLALLLSFHGNARPWLRALPWFSFARVSGRFSVAYPALLVAVGLAVPDSLFRRRTGRVLALLGAALLATEAATAYSVCLTRPRRHSTPDPRFLAMMATIRESPGAAVLDWPFCIAGGNGVGTGELGRYYALQAGVSSLQVFHGKKIVGMYFGRLHPDQLRPYEEAGWPHLFLSDSRDGLAGRHQRRDFLPSEWAFLEEFVKANDFAGIVLYTDILPPETVAGFHARFGEPVSAAFGEPYGRIEFIPKRSEWQAFVDPVRGRQLRLEYHPAPWPPDERIRIADPRMDEWLGQGWRGANTEGHEAQIAFGLERVERLFWRARVRSFGRQRLKLELNGREVAVVDVRPEWGTVAAELPAALFRADNRLVLRLPDAHSPRSVEPESRDARVLGVEAEWMEIRRHRFPTPPFGARLAADTREVEQFLGSGWGGGEPSLGLRSTRGHEASVRFGLAEIRPLEFAIEIQTVGRQRLAVELNGVPLWQGTGDGGWFRGTLGLPAGALRAENELVFLLPDAHSPKSLGLSQDDRVLGLAVRWIRFDRRM